ncbi:MAG: hypothetical protein HZA91_17550 [Verrucomicrobia bacterium]|nr:hypothetical protein [Verrucomicrobiota bacterium]
MNSCIYVPNTLRGAACHLRATLPVPLDTLPKQTFVRAWCSIAYIYPGLHPDGYDDADSGWPRVLRRFAAEAWRRADAGELADEELYPCDAQWSGLYDRMRVHEPDKTERRLELAAAFGNSGNA